MINVLNNTYTKLQNSVFYYTYSLKLNIDLVLSTSLSYLQVLPSQINLFKNISWPEREVLEMFNVIFKNKIDTRQLLLDFLFIGFPLLKTFSLSGFIQIEFSLI
jgi:NADH:ubiquinone oxidoreductase subunit C